MTVLYVREQGAVVRREGEELRVTLKEKILARLPVREAEQVVLVGNVQLTTQALGLLVRHEVDVVFMTLGGKMVARALPEGSRFARLRHAQLALCGDERRSLEIAKEIVRAKLANQRTLLTQLIALTPPAAETLLVQAAGGIERMRRDSSGAGDANTLRGFEGKAAVFYFGAIGALLGSNWAFTGRKYYPPPDPFNAALSFGYGLLQKDVAAAVQLVGLDPYLGCFHALQYDRPSLVLDLMEEFRPPVVDRTVLELALSGKLRPNEFTFTGQSERPVELGAALVPRLIAAYEAHMSAPVLHGPSGTHNTYRRAIELQARVFARVVMGARAAYEGV